MRIETEFRRRRQQEAEEASRAPCSHVAELERNIAAIQEMTKTLTHLASHCHGDDRPDCPIIEEIANGGGNERRPSAPFGITSLK
ncbi:hypothetical protein J2Z31_005184 [Sinorhizobium kostiense]|uniref:Cu(I)-responsive transcriptional regulator n=1 Tax=Sinorhizobium kostiense TaxID=76747 RepID=A0ABS4R6Y3_9HYPH|nr:hypothetical protein [Sinorhizobium kostiense]